MQKTAFKLNASKPGLETGNFAIQVRGLSFYYVEKKNIAQFGPQPKENLNNSC